MLAATLLMLQVSGPPDVKARVVPAATASCPPAAASGDVVVCGTIDREQFRLRPLPSREAPKQPVRAETTIAGKARISLEAEQAGVAAGQLSRRAMVRFKVPF